ncbi:hypothetical protein BGX27_010289 [Mortierella sp. AM989]|nr:hypothetical protein BGX27_010289 [Mortierella sp. AM989]
MELTKTTEQASQLSLELTKTVELIPQLSSELTQIKNGLHCQLEGLEVFLSHRDSFILHNSAKEYDILVKNLLATLLIYIDSTLVDLFRFIDAVSSLTRNYNRGFARFIHYSADTIRGLESCITEIQAMNQHSKTVEELSTTASQISKLTKEYEAEPLCPPKPVAKSKLVSYGLGVSGLAVGATLVVAFPPIAAIGAGLLVTGNEINNYISLYERSKSENNLETATKPPKLHVVEGCSGDFQTPLYTIYSKLDQSKKYLKVSLVNDPENNGKESYAAAQEEAGNITRVCQEIGDYALQFTILKGKVALRLKQITELQSNGQYEK